MVQQRQVRKEHLDARCASASFSYEKEFAVKFRDHVTMVLMDDKYKVKVGERVPWELWREAAESWLQQILPPLRLLEATLPQKILMEVANTPKDLLLSSVTTTTASNVMET